MAMDASPTASPPRLLMRGIRKAFGATQALGGVDLRVDSGQILALVGENGAGKSTLMKVLSGAHPPDAGEMWLDGVPYLPRTPHEARLAGVAMIYQELALAPHLSVMENILLGMEPVRSGFLRRDDMRRKAVAALKELGRSDIAPDARVERLTIADRQIVEIARALAVGCRVLVLDEPTSSLAREDIQHLFARVRDLKQRGYAIVYISHFLEEVKAISDRFVVLRDGHSVGEGATASTPAARIIEQMVGREVKDLYPRSPRMAGEVLLEVDGLAGADKPVRASLMLRRGEVLGIAGLVGAGRTEFLRTVFGLAPVRRGTVRVGGYVGPASPARRWAQGMGMVSEDRKNEGLAQTLSVADNTTLSRLEGLGPWGLVLPRRQAEVTRRWIAELQIKCGDPGQAVQSLSGGNQQKVAFGRLLHHDVDVLLLDEPTRGIDVGSKAQIYRVIDALAARGKAVLMVSNYLPELLGVCDRVAVMCRGELGPARPVSEVDEHSIMAESTGVV
jgi:ribose transport system ATP-binding protein